MTTCAYLSGNTILACKANLRLYVPSMSELDSFCTNDKHDICPVYLGRTFESSECYPQSLIRDAAERKTD